MSKNSSAKMENVTPPPKTNNMIKSLQVMAITRQSFDDSQKETDETGVFIRTNSISNQTFDPFLDDNMRKPVALKPKTSTQILAPIEDPPLELGAGTDPGTVMNMNRTYGENSGWEKDWKMDFGLGSLPSEISGFAFNENVTETKGLMSDLENELRDLRGWRQTEQDT